MKIITEFKGQKHVELIGHVFKMIFEGNPTKTEWGGRDHYDSSYDVFGWSGFVSIEILSTKETIVQEFRIGFSRSRMELEDALFASGRGLMSQKTINNFNVIDYKKVVDWLAQRIRKEPSLNVPDIDAVELVKLGAITDSCGQVHMCL